MFVTAVEKDKPDGPKATDWEPRAQDDNDDTLSRLAELGRFICSSVAVSFPQGTCQESIINTGFLQLQRGQKCLLFNCLCPKVITDPLLTCYQFVP